MEFTKEELTKWLRAELVDLVKDIETVRASDTPEFNQGLDIICAYDTKVEKILEKLAVPELYEALKMVTLMTSPDNPSSTPSINRKQIYEALAKAEGLKFVSILRPVEGK